MPIVSTLHGILLSVLPVFTEPTGPVFLRLVAGWVLCPTRRTVTGMILFADPDGLRSHDTYHRFFRSAAWCLRQLFRAWAVVLVNALCPEGTLWLVTDDTVHQKTGRKVAGAAWCRDAVRSTGQRIVYVWGLKIVPVCLRVVPPWGGEPLALPIAFRVYRKGGPTLLDLVDEMLTELSAAFPDRSLVLTADGFYAPLAGRRPDRTHLISRMRCDAALYTMPPPRRPGQRGRPRKKGKRLPSPAAMAAHARTWKPVETIERGRKRTRLVYTRRVLWYHVQPDRPVLLVISRDPDGKEKDDFFFTTDLDMDPATVISEFAGRWSIEDTFRNTKQFLGGEHPQCWRTPGPERAAGFAYFLYGVVWLWHIRHGHAATPLLVTPWYPHKTTPSFKDALAALRKALWRERFFHTVGRRAQLSQFQTVLIDALARAA
jgi:hypothetical protein